MRGECEVDGKIAKLQVNWRDREMGNTDIHAISIAFGCCQRTHTLTVLCVPVLHILRSQPLYAPHQPVPSLVPTSSHKNVDGDDPLQQEGRDVTFLEC